MRLDDVDLNDPVMFAQYVFGFGHTAVVKKAYSGEIDFLKRVLIAALAGGDAEGAAFCIGRLAGLGHNVWLDPPAAR